MRAQIILVAIFFVVTFLLLWASRRYFRQVTVHGFYRFFAWESILMLVVFNLPVWFQDPLSWHQVLSWIFLFGSINLAVAGFWMLWKFGRPQDYFENTTILVDGGIFAFIRHPMYASLLCLAWGAFFKRPMTGSLVLGILASLFLYLTARVEEKENIARFGEPYRAYMSRTRMFLPGIF